MNKKITNKKINKRILIVAFLKKEQEKQFKYFGEFILKKNSRIDFFIQSDSKDSIHVAEIDLQDSDITIFYQQENLKKLEIYKKIVFVDFSEIDEKQIQYDTVLSEDNDLDTYYLVNSANKANNSILIISPKMFEYVLETHLISKDETIKAISTILSKLDIPFIKKTFMEGEPKKNKKNIFKVIRKGISFWLYWFFKLPLHELKTKPHKRYTFIKVNSFYRTLFLLLILFVFIALPILSLSVGISGDEEVWQYPQSQRIINFYKTFGEDKSYKDVEANFHTYGNSFDTISSVVINSFKIKDIYEARHIMNSLVGCFIILIIGLLVKRVTDWRGGVIAVILMLLSPRFIGHTLNNPKDIPFAFGYVFAMYYFIKFYIEFPKINYRTLILASLGIGATLSVRAGGLVLLPCLIAFAGAYLFFKVFIQKQKFKYVSTFAPKLLLAVVFICILGYLFGIPLWPYALENPIKNPINALTILTNYSVGIRQLFDGQILWSDGIPSSYLLRYYSITTPIVVIVGLLFFFVFFNKWDNKLKVFLAFALIFSFVFPVSYIIYKKSNLYGVIRHTIFIYPMIVSTASVGINNFLYKFKTNITKLIASIFLVIICLHPLIHIIRNKPLIYVYFNQFVGGVKGAYGNYELDYYYHSLKKASNWLINNELSDKSEDTITIATNFSVSYYFRNYKDQIKTTYVRYYERGNTDWDYAIIANAYINPDQLKKHIWPPENTIHTIDVDGVPVCAILKRNQKYDYEGYQKLKKRDYLGAIADYNEAIKLDKTNEVAYINLATAYMYIRRFDLSRKTINQLLEIYPKYDKGLNMLGLTYFNEGNNEEAYKIFTSITEMNPKFVNAYHNLGLVFLRMDKKNDALKYFQQAIKTNRNFKPPYLAIANILKESGKEKEAQKYIDAANKLK